MKVIINLHGNKRLADAVMAMLPEAIRSHPTLIRRVEAILGKSGGPHLMLRIKSEANRLLDAGNAHEITYEQSSWNDYERINAATQMGRLAELIDAPAAKVIEKVTSRNSGVVPIDKSGIHVGCEFVTRAKVKECYDALFGEESKPVPVPAVPMEPAISPMASH